jgi:hypothetical protein
MDSRLHGNDNAMNSKILTLFIPDNAINWDVKIIKLKIDLK